jgi:hypothetical protein
MLPQTSYAKATKGPKYRPGCYQNLEFLARMNTEQRTWRVVSSDERTTKDRISAYLLGYFEKDDNIRKLDLLLEQWRRLGSNHRRNLIPSERNTLAEKVDVPDITTSNSGKTSNSLYGILQSNFESCHCEEVPHAARLCLTPRSEHTYGATDYLEILFSVNLGVGNHQWQKAKVELLRYFTCFPFDSNGS